MLLIQHFPSLSEVLFFEIWILPLFINKLINELIW